MIGCLSFPNSKTSSSDYCLPDGGELSWVADISPKVPTGEVAPNIGAEAPGLGVETATPGPGGKNGGGLAALPIGVGAGMPNNLVDDEVSVGFLIPN